MTYDKKVQICNDVSNWFADTVGVVYFEHKDMITVQEHYSEFLKHSKNEFKEIKKFWE